MKFTWFAYLTWRQTWFRRWGTWTKSNIINSRPTIHSKTQTTEIINNSNNIFTFFFYQNGQPTDTNDVYLFTYRWEWSMRNDQQMNEMKRRQEKKTLFSFTTCLQLDISFLSSISLFLFTSSCLTSFSRCRRSRLHVQCTKKINKWKNVYCYTQWMHSILTDKQAIRFWQFSVKKSCRTYKKCMCYFFYLFKKKRKEKKNKKRSLLRLRISVGFFVFSFWK